MIKVFTYLTILGILFSGCKKYPEDETFIHLRRAKNRVTEKDLWHITEYKVNDVDSIPYINSKLQHQLGEYKMHWKGGFDIETGGGIYFKVSDDKKIADCGFRVPSWGLTYPLMLDGVNQWTIRRLDRESLIIEIIKNSKKYRVKFETI